MSTLKVERLNPKAAKLLKDLADMNLITVNKFPENSFSKILARFRTKEKKPSLADNYCRSRNCESQKAWPTRNCDYAISSAFVK